MTNKTIFPKHRPLNIGVFCAANDWPKQYTKTVVKFAQLLAKRDHVLIYGGSNSGLMRLVATNVQAGGGKVVGVPLPSLKEGIYEEADEIVMVETIAERKATLLSRSDAIVVLVGGNGTLDEATDAIEHKRHGLHTKPIVILNTDNFYEGLRLQFERIQADGLLLPYSVNDLVHFADTPTAAMEYVERAVS